MDYARAGLKNRRWSLLLSLHEVETGPEIEQANEGPDQFPKIRIFFEGKLFLYDVVLLTTLSLEIVNEGLLIHFIRILYNRICSE